MPSPETILCLGVLIVLALCVWRFTSTLTRITEYGSRSDERQALQRDRLMLMVIEKMQVQGSTDQAVRIAQQHGHEAAQGMAHHLQRDGAADAAKARRATRERKHREAVAVVAPGADKDAMT